MAVTVKCGSAELISQHRSCCGGRAYGYSRVQIHAGGSAVVSDLQGATWTFLEWVKKNLDGEGL